MYRKYRYTTFLLKTICEDSVSSGLVPASSILFHSAFNLLIKSAVYRFLNTRKIIEMLHLDANLIATYSRVSLFIRTPVMRIY